MMQKTMLRLVVSLGFTIDVILDLALRILILDAGLEISLDLSIDCVLIVILLEASHVFARSLGLLARSCLLSGSLTLPAGLGGSARLDLSYLVELLLDGSEADAGSLGILEMRNVCKLLPVDLGGRVSIIISKHGYCDTM